MPQAAQQSQKGFPSCNSNLIKTNTYNTRRAPKPYYCIELQKKSVINRTVQTGKYSRLRDQQAFYLTRQSPRLPPEADQALEKSRQSLDSPLTTKTSNSLLLAKQKNKKLLHSTNA